MSSSASDISFFSKVPFTVLVHRNSAFAQFLAYDGSASGIYKRYLLPLALCPSAVFLITALLFPMTPQPVSVLLIGIILMSGISMVLTHLWSLLAEALLVARNYPCSRVDALKITAIATTPWFLVFSFFPLIGGSVIIGALWAATLIRPSIERFADVSQKDARKISAALFMSWIAAYLFSNLFFIGILSIAGG